MQRVGKSGPVPRVDSLLSPSCGWSSWDKKKPRQHKLSGQGENGYSLCATIVRSLERALSEERVTLRARR